MSLPLGGTSFSLLAATAGEEGTTSIKALTDGPAGRRGDDGLDVVGGAAGGWFRLLSRLNDEGRSDMLMY